MVGTPPQQQENAPMQTLKQAADTRTASSRPNKKQNPPKKPTETQEPRLEKEKCCKEKTDQAASIHPQGAICDICCKREEP